jgi:hypothetical protein
MEENAVNYLYQDHFTPFIETIDGRRQSSSLFNLSVALTSLGSIYLFDHTSSFFSLQNNFGEIEKQSILFAREIVIIAKVQMPCLGQNVNAHNKLPL